MTDESARFKEQLEKVLGEAEKVRLDILALLLKNEVDPIIGGTALAHVLGIAVSQLPDRCKAIFLEGWLNHVSFVARTVQVAEAFLEGKTKH